jgi:TPR repeat protein
MPDPSASSQNADTQPILVGPPRMPAAILRPARRRLRRWIGGAVAVLILAGAALSYLRERPSAVPGTDSGFFRSPRTIPPTLRPYYDRALTGDANAMRMLGTMYYNGLNVPPDTREGIRWYRKAAAAGSVAAKTDLEQLGLAPE